MALSYDDWKKQWEGMDYQTQQRTANMMKDNSTFREYWQRYVNESKNTGSTVSNNQNSNVNNTQWTNTPTTVNNVNNWNNNNGNNWGDILWRDTTAPLNADTWNKPQQTVDNQEQLDTSKFWQSTWQINVKEWTAAQTWQPDYQSNSEARQQEIVNNLNTYWEKNREFFKDRNTFNQIFHYDERDASQKQLLDSYWKKKQDTEVSNKYGNVDALYNGMNNAELTNDQLDIIKYDNPDLYKQWQAKQEEETNLRIANLTTPWDVTSVTELFNTLMEKLNLEPWDPYKIYDNWYDMCERLWVFSDSAKLQTYQSQLDANHTKMESIMTRYASSAWGTQSDALVAARLSKALAPYQQIETDLQNSYTALLNGRNSNLAVANQSAQALAMQAAEDQRIFNQRLAGLWFAYNTAEFRTYEQKAQVDLQKQQILNDMSILQQSRQNDLALYNQRQQNQLQLQHMYDTAEMQNAINLDMTDLTVENEWQLRANLNNVLSQYYAQWWDIIKRPQQLAVDDIIAYAKEKWISVSQALKENFLDKLQEKEEYQNALASKYPTQKTWDNWSYSIDEDWKLKVNVSWTWNLNLSEVQKNILLGNKQTYSDSWMKWAWLRNNNPWNIKDSSFWNVLWHDEKWFAIFATPEDWFDALVKKIENIQNWWKSVYSKDMTLYQFFAKYAPSSDNNNPKAYAESVAKQLWTTANATVGSVDATKFAAAIAKHDSWYDYKTYWQFRTDDTYWGLINTDGYVSNPYSWSIWKTSSWAEINAWWWITSLEKEFWNSQRKSDKEREEMYKSYWIDKKTYDEMEYNYAKYLEKTEWIKTLQDSIKRAEDLLKWNQDNHGLHSWFKDIETVENWYYSFMWWLFKWTTKAADWKALFDLLKNNETLNKFLDLKKNNASFWQMSEWEWDLVWNSTNALNWFTSDKAFEETLKKLINTYKEQLYNIDPSLWRTEEQQIEHDSEKYFSWQQLTWVNQNLTDVTDFILNWRK